jgi:uncharacterized protein with HEPN domain
VRDGKAYLELVAESITLVEQYVIAQGGTPSVTLFSDDLRTQDAVLRRLEILADAAGHLSGELKARHPEIAWRKINDFRNVLAHAYMEVDLDLVWSAIEDDLPALKVVVDAELTNRT